MVYLRTKKVNGKTYYYLVSGKKVRGKTKTETIAYLGKMSGSTNHLIKKFDEVKKALEEYKKK